MSFPMTNFLHASYETVTQFSSGLGTRADLIVLHDCKGGNEGSIQCFETNRSSVSARCVVRRTATAAQTVDLAGNAWHAQLVNRRSVGVEMGCSRLAGFEAF
jgi:N-acetyl-anhydromuramyl-L-alanine amidase AmpD